MNVLSGFIIEITQMSPNQGMDKQTIVHLHNGTPLRNKKKQTTDTPNNMNNSQIYYAIERSQTQKAANYLIPFMIF